MQNPTLELYRDDDRQYRWRFVAGNGNVLADSGQGYRHKADCVHGAGVVLGGRVMLYQRPTGDSAGVVKTRRGVTVQVR